VDNDLLSAVGKGSASVADNEAEMLTLVDEDSRGPVF
jgi:hypothetical protein